LSLLLFAINFNDYLLLKKLVKKYKLKLFLGYFPDTVSEEGDRNIEPKDGNSGWLQRGCFFRKNRNQLQAFRPEGATFLAPFKVFIKQIKPLIVISDHIKRLPPYLILSI